MITYYSLFPIISIVEKQWKFGLNEKIANILSQLTNINCVADAQSQTDKHQWQPIHSNC